MGDNRPYKGEEALADPKSALASTFNVPEIKMTMREIRDADTEAELAREEVLRGRNVENPHIHASLDSILG